MRFNKTHPAVPRGEIIVDPGIRDALSWAIPDELKTEQARQAATPVTVGSLLDFLAEHGFKIVEPSAKIYSLDLPVFCLAADSGLYKKMFKDFPNLHLFNLSLRALLGTAQQRGLLQYAGMAITDISQVDKIMRRDLTNGDNFRPRKSFHGRLYEALDGIAERLSHRPVIPAASAENSEDVFRPRRFKIFGWGPNG